MPKSRHSPNARIVREYLLFLEDAKRLSTITVDQVAAHIAAFEASTGGRDFHRFHVEQARKFKRDLREQVHSQTGKPLATATVTSRLKALRNFFVWLADRPSYRSRLKYSDAEYFNPTNNELRIGSAQREISAPTVEEIRAVVANMPATNEIELRDRALIAFTLLSGARDNAIASLSLKHVDLKSRTLFQDAREVRTKNRKTFGSWFFPVGDDFEQLVVDWIGYLVRERSFGPDHPLFPATQVGLDPEGRFQAQGLGESHWSNGGGIREAFRKAFASAGLPYANPHSFRDTLTLLGEKLCRTPEEFKIWSQNLGHEKVMTTFTSYGEVSSHRQGEILNAMRNRPIASPSEVGADPDPQTVERVIAFLRRRAAG